YYQAVASALLHSCPTRRSSDLPGMDPQPGPVRRRGQVGEGGVIRVPVVVKNIRYAIGCVARYQRVGFGGRVSGCFLYPYCKHVRSEEHTSELQSRENLVCRLLL